MAYEQRGERDFGGGGAGRGGGAAAGGGAEGGGYEGGGFGRGRGRRELQLIFNYLSDLSATLSLPASHP